MVNKSERPSFNNPFFFHDNEDLSCGIWGWKPKWLQRFNNMKVFMLCYVLLGIFHGMTFSYFGAMLPSIQKRFGFSSQSIGTAKSMNDVSHLLTALLIGHYGGSGSAHRPRWISAGSFVLGIGLLLIAAPEVLFPVSKSSTLFAVITASNDDQEQLCSANRTANAQAKKCGEPGSQNDNVAPLIVFGLAEFLVGLGATTHMILGLPFVDDQVGHQKTPIYFALSFAGSLFGPLVGLGFGAVFNTIFFDFSHPEFKQTDPRWISAWYLGFIISGTGVCLFALTLGCFPSTIPESTQKKDDGSNLKKNSENIEKKRPISKPIVLKDLPKNLKKLVTNYTYVTKVFSVLVNSFVISGFMSFTKKFMQEQYHLSPFTVTVVGGFPPIFAGFVGIGIGGFLINRFKFRPIQVAYLMIASSIVGAICYFSVIALGCDMQKIVGVDDVPNPYNLSSGNLCVNSKNCGCDDLQFNPICDNIGKVSYVSPCVAGCRSSKRINNKKYYIGCSCVANNSHTAHRHNHPNTSVPRLPNKSRVVPELCPKYCPNFVIYVVIMSISAFFMGMPSSGILMLQFRIVDTDLKSLANAVTIIVTSALGFLPAPIITGKLIDSACRLWQISPCGDKRACWLYNANDFRWKIHGAVGIVRLISCVLDGIIAYRVRNLSFDREQEKSSELPTVASTFTFLSEDDVEENNTAMELQERKETHEKSI